MAIASDIYSGPYTASGSQTTFPFTFTAVAASDVSVQVNGSDVSSTLYTVTINDDGTGAVTFSVAPASGSTILPYLDPDFSQETIYENEGAYKLDTVNKTNRRGAMRSNFLSKMVATLQPSSIFSAGARIGKFLSWDANGNPYYASGTGADAGLRTDIGATTGAALVGTPLGSAQLRIDSLAGGPGLHGITGQSNALGVYASGSNPAYSANKSWNPQTSTWGSSDYRYAPWSLSQPDGNSGCNNYLLGVMAYCYEKSRQPQYSVMDAWSGTSIAKWIKQDTLTGDGATTTFNLTVPLDASAGSNNVTITSVTVNGVPVTAYTTTTGIYNVQDGTITFSVAPAASAVILVNYSAPRWYAFKAKVEAAIASSAIAALSKTALDTLVWAQCEEDFTRASAWYLDKLSRLHAQFTAESWITNSTRMFMVGPSGLHDRYEASEVIRWFCAASTQPANFWRYIPSDGEQTLYDSTGAGDYTHFLGQSAFDIGYQRIGPAMFAQARFGSRVPYNPFWSRGSGKVGPTDTTYIFKASSLISWESRTGGPQVSDTFTGDGTTTAFTLTLQGTVTTVYVAGALKTVTTDYTVSGSTITFTTAPANGAAILVLYGSAINGPAASNSMIWGFRNWSSGNFSAAFGQGHVLSAQHTFAAGRGHVLADAGTSAVGTFSAYTTTQTDPVVLQVGVGSSTGARANAVAVRKSGVIEQKTLTVATLPAAGIAGRRAFVTDANATTFASIVAAGGSNKVPVYDDGTNWRIG